ncbi:hypothetical protein BN2127_JRS1_02218 [Bacillus cereus]|nr:hypothetical protein BN2127_JRS1_02218 [Bacillus cereus]
MKENIGNLNEVRAVMVFLVMTIDDQFEVELDFSCGEDIVIYMKLYLEQNRKELFKNITYVCETYFQGIQMLVRDTFRWTN